MKVGTPNTIVLFLWIRNAPKQLPVEWCDTGTHPDRSKVFSVKKRTLLGNSFLISSKSLFSLRTIDC